MRIRGRRRCADCGEEWQYYDTGDVTCPVCGSIHSVGVGDERRLHTDAPVDLELADVRAGVDTRPLREVADGAEEAALAYVSARGFVHAGELQPLDETIVAANELRHVAAHLRRSIRDPDDAAKAYFLELLSDAPDGERPEAVPGSLQGPHGLALADVVDRYRGEMVEWLVESDRSPPAVLETLGDHVTRVEALDGEVPPGDADTLLKAVREMGSYVREDDETALVRAEERLAGLA
jgi:uncharacterized Zn finger protein (UPF0148 family)